jgi:NAD(P)H-hydrate epimerase
MEAAGWQTARHCPDRTFVACGRGNNGGDGLAAARHLQRWGRLAGVACLDRSSLSGLARRQADALEALGIEIKPELDLGDAPTVLDAIFGTGLNRAPEGRGAEWIRAINASDRTVIAVDVPSGLDSDTGRALDPCVRASLTVTLGLPKTGLLQADGPGLAGEVWIADIGIPFEAYRQMGLEVPSHLFSTADRVRLVGLRA